MIDESRTLEIYGYTSDELKPHSQKRVIAVCEECGKYRDVTFQQYFDLCHLCAMCTDKRRKALSDALSGHLVSDETRRKLSEANTGHHHTESSRRKLSEAHTGKRQTEETRKKMSIARSGKQNSFYGKYHSEETRQRISAVQQGVSYDEWESFACKSPYCPRFNISCKESNREKYGRRCFICGLPEPENITSTGKHRKLSVHHADMQKSQGCDGVKWKLVPVCLKCHHPLHTKLWKARIIYLLNNVWS